VTLLTPTPAIRPSSRAVTNAPSCSTNLWVGHLLVQHAQVHRGELLDIERRKVFLDAGAELIGVVVRQDTAGIVASRSNLADQGQPVGVGEECFADQRVDHAGPVKLGSVDVIDTGVDGGTQDRERFLKISGRTVDAVAGQLHRCVPRARHRFVGQAIAIARRRVHRRCLPQRLPASTPLSRADGIRSLCESNRNIQLHDISSYSQTTMSGLEAFQSA